MGWGGQPHAPAASTLGKDPVPIVQEAGLATGPVWTGGNSRPHRDSIPDRPARSQSLYRLGYPAHISYINLHNPSGRAIHGVGLRSLACWGAGWNPAGVMDVCCECRVLSDRGVKRD